MQKINTVIQTFPKILATSYFREFWACRSMPDYTQQKLHNYPVASCSFQGYLKSMSTKFVLIT